ncbi:RusA family crossover junction endodeoxyribonuclease [Alloscardovia omnicolens]|uniref:Crossover junction endodeoxyribonuclease RusA n=1 Tax=Alloscardovia omnicolens F0580 TaxID=1321816 RepID=U1SCW9_9BIFI|nr:RusA family crossover junction endodeoxyribonuclease [Alloscardovia omnicolens]ERH29763.1 crossover junction endodeoxyribonuclease RusA [Alloscardovia omnicolens F0580]MBS6347106.1 RusA family crossover junction endodeoxyribonuclease [Alloscardovia omnicolens]MDK6643105.1 RusA family crossover junction endodeoxyribonuclease [Alloscardovia omnicolens]
MTVREFTVAGEPRPKKRPKVFHGRGVNPKENVVNERAIRDAYIAAFPDAPRFTGNVQILMMFYLGDFRRVDVDNLAKLVQDALNGVAFVDDSQITRLVAGKVHPSRMVPGQRGRLRKRRAGDVLTRPSNGEPYDPHTEVVLISDDGEEG